jgi:hypothetical protein
MENKRGYVIVSIEKRTHVPPLEKCLVVFEIAVGMIIKTQYS